MDRNLKIGLLLTSLLFILAGSFLFYKTYQFVNHSDSAVGVVVEIKTMKSSNETRGRSGPVERPFVEFKTGSGKVIQFIPKVGSHKSSFKIGDKLNILYEKNHPEKAVLNRFETTWLFPIILWGLAAIIFGVTHLLGKLMPT